jgi:hypothetical protein
MKPAGFAIALAFGAGIAAAGPLVVKSSGPSASGFRPGTALANDARITLKAGDTVVILDGRGTRTLRGPGTFSPQAPSTQLAETRRAPVQASGTRARIGAVRGLAGIGESTRNPNIWFVDVGRSAKICVTDTNSLTLWRGGTRGPAVMTITGGGKSGKVEWINNQSVRDWPASLPVADGSEYVITGNGRQPATKLRFVVIASQSSGLEDTASLLIRHGCQAQLDLLVETVSVPGAVAEPAE